MHGKAFWLGYGLPTEGTDASLRRVGPAADPGVPVCLLGETVATARQRIAEADGWDLCLVTNRDNILAGRLRPTNLDGPAEAIVDDVMELGPGTVRPDADLDELRGRMSERNLSAVIVTDPRGRLVGVYRQA